MEDLTKCPVGIFTLPCHVTCIAYVVKARDWSSRSTCANGTANDWIRPLRSANVTTVLTGIHVYSYLDYKKFPNKMNNTHVEPKQKPMEMKSNT